MTRSSSNWRIYSVLCGIAFASGCGSNSADGPAAGNAGSGSSPSGASGIGGAGSSGSGGQLAASGAAGQGSAGTASSAGAAGSGAGSSGASSAGSGSAGSGGASGAAGSSAAAGSAGATANPTWVGTWAVSPQCCGNAFEKQTLRQIVHTSISGSAARVQLSNAFGKQAIVVQDVHVAKRSTGSSVDLASDRVVTFAGQNSISIPAGGLAVSDSIAFAVGALTDVAVSFYLPQGTGPITYHQQGTQTNYAASGDVAGNAALTGTQSSGSYYLLANLDVKNEQALGAVATLGASITDGVGSSQDNNRRWPNDLAKRLNVAGQVVGVLNQGISGNQLLKDGAGESALKRFQRDVLAQPGIAWLIFSDDPINDLGSGSNRPSGAQLIEGLKQLVAAAHVAHVKFLCSTLTPFEGSGGWSSDGEVARAQINAFVRSADSGCDGVVDQDSATHDPAQPTKFLAKLHVGDWLHPNEAGLQAIADAVNLQLLK